MVGALEGYDNQIDNQAEEKQRSRHHDVPIKQQGRPHWPKQTESNKKTL